MRTLLALLALLSLPTLAAGQTLCGKPVTRFFDVVSANTLRSNTAPNLHGFGTAFVFADGSYLASGVNAVSFRQGPIGGNRGEITRATSSTVSFADLRRAATEARVGILGGCRIVRPRGEEFYFIRWYGRNGRTNTFTITSETGPECPPEVVTFLNLLFSYLGSPGPAAERFTAMP